MKGGVKQALRLNNRNHLNRTGRQRSNYSSDWWSKCYSVKNGRGKKEILREKRGKKIDVDAKE